MSCRTPVLVVGMSLDVPARRNIPVKYPPEAVIKKYGPSPTASHPHSPYLFNHSLASFQHTTIKSLLLAQYTSVCGKHVPFGTSVMAIMTHIDVSGHILTVSMYMN